MNEKKRLLHERIYGRDIFCTYEILDETGDRFVEIIKNGKDSISKRPVRHHDPVMEKQRKKSDKLRYENA